MVVWNYGSGEKIKHQLFQEHQGDIRAIQFSSNGDYLFTGSFDKTVKQWCVKTGEVARTFVGHNNGILFLSKSADDRLLLAVASDGKVRIWYTDNQDYFGNLGAPQQRFDVALLHPNGKIFVNCISFYSFCLGFTNW